MVLKQNRYTMPSIVRDESQAQLPLADARAFVCPHCSTVLPDYAPDSYQWEHCDPRPPMLGLAYRDKVNYE